MLSVLITIKVVSLNPIQTKTNQIIPIVDFLFLFNLIEGYVDRYESLHVFLILKKYHKVQLVTKLTKTLSMN
jgi:hypothetical protein